MRLPPTQVLRELGIEFVDIKEFKCCGYPLRNLNFEAYLLSAARNLALAERAGLDILTTCNCCYGSLKYAEHVLKKFVTAKEQVNASLAADGLKFSGTVSTKHLLGVLHDDLGVETIRKRLKKTLERPENRNVITAATCSGQRKWPVSTGAFSR